MRGSTIPPLKAQALSIRGSDGPYLANGKHRAAYERNGVPHYWIADPQTRTIEVYTLEGVPYEGGQYGKATVLRQGDVLHTPLFAGVSVSVSRIFQDVIQSED